MPIRHRTSLKIVAAVLGILIAGAPLILFNVWLKKQGSDEVAVTAAWALGSAETTVLLRPMAFRPHLGCDSGGIPRRASPTGA